MGFDPYHPLPSHEGATIDEYLRRESEHIAVRGYSDLPENNRRRQIALHRILQYSKSENFDAFVPYLAMNYFDRYVSRKGLPNIRDNWIEDTDILATACLSYAWGMRDNSFNFASFLTERQIIHKKHNIIQVEFGIPKALDWQMFSITALCFAPFLVEVCELSKGLRGQTICQIVLEMQDDIRFTAFKPSTISASAILVGVSYLYRKHYRVYEHRLVSLEYIDKEELMQCMPLVKEMCAKKQLRMETVETDIIGRPLMSVQAGPASPPTTLQSLSYAPIMMRHIEGSPKMQPGVELDSEPEPVPEIQVVDDPPTMDFELKWAIDKEVDSLLNPPLAAPYCLGLLPCNNSDRCPCTML